MRVISYHQFHPLLFGEIQRSAQEVARRISGAVAGELAQKSTYQVPITIPISRIKLFASCFPLPHFSLAILFALSLYPPSLSLFASFCPFAFCLLVCWIVCLLRWLKIIPNCVTFPILLIIILLVLRLLLPLVQNLMILMPFCWILLWKINFPAFLVKMSHPI